MKQKNRMIKRFAALILMLACATLAFGDGEKERMTQRVSKIDALKIEGIVGEMANGLLGFVKESAADQALVDAENNDRKTVYEAIAKKQGVTPKSVAKSRAASLAERAVRGVWVQDAGGKWVQKK